MHAGDFGSYELTFLSTDIEQKAVDKVLEIMSSNMAALMQLTRSSHAQVVPFGLSQDSMHKQSVQPLLWHSIC